ncbi:MAG TPA: DNA mismatch repair endonuclease MutL [Bacteroidales bacterium]
MADIIKLLPDSVANQIAAGEVIQRPASVVKELVENAVDAGSSAIGIYIKDAGRTSVQVIDNGCGLSATDARMAFERHATSKIRDAKDLFSIRTLGFRGEALASIAAIAEVKLRSKRIGDELGTEIDIAATQVVHQEPVNCAEGSNFLVRNLFYNTPARRKFLKANTTELKHIINEFQRVALTHPEIEISLHHNGVEIYNLPVSNFRQRICNVFGKSMNQYLVPINADTSIVKISGLVGKPEAAKKTAGEQFFFVNQRYIRHPFLHRAVIKAFEQLLPADALPTYFIYFEIDPESIDINIHPTKTEVKFEDEQSIFQILVASLKEALGKFNIVPTLDFNIDTSIEIPVLRKGEDVRQPSIDVNPNYNPFDEDKSSSQPYYKSSFQEADKLKQWERLYEGLIPGISSPSEDGKEEHQQPLYQEDERNINTSNLSSFQFKNKFILTPVKSGLMIIDQKRAHERILFERYMNMINNHKGLVQRSLFPEIIELTIPEMNCLKEIFDDVYALGFDLTPTSETKVQVNGYPADAATVNPVVLLRGIIEACMNDTSDIEKERKEQIAREMAQAASIPYGKQLSPEEMKDLVDNLFACSMPNFSPSGKNVISIWNLDEIEKRF